MQQQRDIYDVLRPQMCGGDSVSVSIQWHHSCGE